MMMLEVPKILPSLLVACVAWNIYFVAVAWLAPWIYLNPEGLSSWPWYKLPEVWRLAFVLMLCALAFFGSFAMIEALQILVLGKGMDAESDRTSLRERSFANVGVAIAIALAVGIPHLSVGRDLFGDWIFDLLWLIVALMPYGAYATRAKQAAGIEGSLPQRLADESIRLISIRWLLAQPEGGPIWRRQDLPAEAFIDASRTGALLAAGKVAAVSYGARLAVTASTRSRSLAYPTRMLTKRAIDA